MRRLQERMPSMSEAERGMKRDLEAMEEKLEVYKRSVKQVWGRGELNTWKDNMKSFLIILDFKMF